MIDFSLYLKQGKKNGISAEKLMNRLGVQSTREVRKLISESRKAGQLIMSDESGYYLPANKEDLQRFIARAEKEAKSIFLILKASKAALKEMENEESQVMTKAFQYPTKEEPERKTLNEPTHEKIEAPADMMQGLKEKLSNRKRQTC